MAGTSPATTGGEGRRGTSPPGDRPLRDPRLWQNRHNSAAAKFGDFTILAWLKSAYDYNRLDLKTAPPVAIGAKGLFRSLSNRFRPGTGLLPVIDIVVSNPRIELVTGFPVR